jgi:hypothetical protein
MKLYIYIINIIYAYNNVMNVFNVEFIYPQYCRKSQEPHIHLELGRIEGFVPFYTNFVDRRVHVVST